MDAFICYSRLAIFDAGAKVSYLMIHCFQAFPIVFTKGHHLNQGVSGLMYLPLPIGGAIAVLAYLWFFFPRYTRAVEKAAPKMVAPEVRLEMAMVAGPIFASAFFWFAWTSFPSISLWAPLISVAFMGFAICLIFVSISTMEFPAPV